MKILGIIIILLVCYSNKLIGQNTETIVIESPWSDYGIFYNGIMTSILNESENPISKIEVFPNPSIDFSEVNIHSDNRFYQKLDLFYSDGKFIKILHQGYLNTGLNKFKINMSNMPSGQYLIRCSGEKNIFFTARFYKI